MDLWSPPVPSSLAAAVLPFAAEAPLAVVVRRHGDFFLPVAPRAARVRVAAHSVWTVLGKALRYAAVIWIALNV